jgi:uncharacterized SAM-binding protein YcdF (DUF218 family)
LNLTGGKTFDEVANAEVMADLASILGINDSDMVLESDSKDTKDEAILIQKIVKDENFILVTSASHMFRSVALFQKLVATHSSTDRSLYKRKTNNQPQLILSKLRQN